MNSKIIAGILVLIVIGLGGYFLTRPIAKKQVSPKNEYSDEEQSEVPKDDNAINEAKKAYQEFLKLKNQKGVKNIDLDKRLEKLSLQFPNDYRFPLERIRGAAKIKGIHNHKEEFELLTTAAQIAIECDCDTTDKMLKDLQKNAKDKSNGFWKLSTHPKQWNPILEALKNEDIEVLEKVMDNHH